MNVTDRRSIYEDGLNLLYFQNIFLLNYANNWMSPSPPPTFKKIKRKTFSKIIVIIFISKGFDIWTWTNFSCIQVECSVITHGQTREFSSMGRRKRRGASSYGVGSASRGAEKDDMVVVQTIQITDKFGFEKEDKLPHRRGKDDGNGKLCERCLVQIWWFRYDRYRLGVLKIIVRAQFRYNSFPPTQICACKCKRNQLQIEIKQNLINKC